MGFQIDHVAISRHNCLKIKIVKVKKWEDIDSDHYPTEIHIRFITEHKTNQWTNKIKKVNNDTLNETVFDFQKLLEEANIDASNFAEQLEV